VTGGSPQEICKADNPNGVNWEANGDIVFGQGAQGIFRVSSNGGSPQRIVTMDEGQVAHGPQMLPGNRVLFTLLEGGDFLWSDAKIVVQSLDTRERRVIFRGGTDARYVAPNHLLYVTNATLVAAPFDVSSLAMGDPVATVPDVAESSNNGSGAAHYALSAGGTLVYVKGRFRAVPRSLLAWVDRRGQELIIPVEPGPYVQPRVSPDGKRVAVGLRDREGNIALIDLERPRLDPLTNIRGLAVSPIWRNAQEVLFAVTRGGNADVWSQVAGGHEPARQLTDAPDPEIPTSVSSDGTTAVISDPNGGALKTLSLIGEPTVRKIDDERGGQGEISPDGRCLAYEARSSVYVRSMDASETPRQVSMEGASQPTWGPDGSELFFVSPAGGLLRAPARTRPACTVGSPQSFISGPYLWSIPSFGGVRFYHIAPDGQRFLLLKPVSEQPPVPRSIVVVQRWFQEWTR
jgi:Tol biopolymer transport system component